MEKPYSVWEEVKSQLPEYIEILGIECKLIATVDTVYCRVTYCSYNGNMFTWSFMPYDKQFEITDRVTTELEFAEYEECGISPPNRVKSSDDLVRQVLTDLGNIDSEYTVINEIVTVRTKIIRELSHVVNKYGLDMDSGTPDHILGSFLFDTILNYTNCVRRVGES
jgi:hypothetical protein